MAKAEQPDFAHTGGLIKEANTLAQLLDPHLRSGSEADNAAGEERRYPRKSLLLVIGGSLVIWATMLAAVWLLLSL